MGKKDKRIRMFYKFKNCFHCGRQLVLYSNDPNDPALASLQNKYDRFDRERYEQPLVKEYRYRLVCLECCRRMDKERQRDIPIDIRRDLANAFPLLDLEGFRAKIIKHEAGNFVFVPDDNGPLWVTEYKNPFLPEKE